MYYSLLNTTDFLLELGNIFQNKALTTPSINGCHEEKNDAKLIISVL